MIYFIQAASGGPIKIGTTLRLTVRLKTVRRERNDPTLQVLAVMDGRHREESALHRRFRHLALGKEWFHPGVELLACIRDEARSWDSADDLQPISHAIIPRRLYRHCRVLAAYKGVRVHHLIEALLAPVVKKELRRMLCREQRRIEADNPAEPPPAP